MDSTGESSPLLLTSVPVSMSCYLCCLYVVVKIEVPQPRRSYYKRGLAGVFISVFATFFVGGSIGQTRCCLYQVILWRRHCKRGIPHKIREEK